MANGFTFEAYRLSKRIGRYLTGAEMLALYLNRAAGVDLVLGSAARAKHEIQEKDWEIYLNSLIEKGDGSCISFAKEFLNRSLTMNELEQLLRVKIMNGDIHTGGDLLSGVKVILEMLGRSLTINELEKNLVAEIAQGKIFYARYTARLLGRRLDRPELKEILKVQLQNKEAVSKRAVRWSVEITLEELRRFQ